MKLWRHIKSGNVYAEIDQGIDCTNGRANAEVVIYVRADNSVPTTFVRERSEFEQKFTPWDAGICEWSEIEDGSGIYNTCRPGEEFHLTEGLELWPHCHFCGKRIEVGCAHCDGTAPCIHCGSDPLPAAPSEHKT